jgi:hypothetical protein
MRGYIDYAVCVIMVAVLYFHLVTTTVADVV